MSGGSGFRLKLRPKCHNCTFCCEFDGRFWIGNPAVTTALSHLVSEILACEDKDFSSQHASMLLCSIGYWLSLQLWDGATLVISAAGHYHLSNHRRFFVLSVNCMQVILLLMLDQWAFASLVKIQELSLLRYTVISLKYADLTVLF